MSRFSDAAISATSIAGSSRSSPAFERPIHPALNLDDPDGDGYTTCDAIFYGTAGQGIDNGWTCDDVCGAGGGVSVGWLSQQEQEDYCLFLHPGTPTIVVATPNNHSYPLWVTQNGVDACDVNADGRKSQSWPGNGTPVYGDQILCRCER